MCMCGDAARENMMMRYAKISPEGDYQPPPPANAKAAYATMVYVRATIVEDAGWVLARATTIAVSHLHASTPQVCKVHILTGPHCTLLVVYLD